MLREASLAPGVLAHQQQSTIPPVPSFLHPPPTPKQRYMVHTRTHTPPSSTFPIIPRQSAARHPILLMFLSFARSIKLLHLPAIASQRPLATPLPPGLMPPMLPQLACPRRLLHRPGNYTIKTKPNMTPSFCQPDQTSSKASLLSETDWCASISVSASLLPIIGHHLKIHDQRRPLLRDK